MNKNLNENQLSIKTDSKISNIKSILENLVSDSCNLTKKEKLEVYIKNNVAKAIIPFRNTQSLSKEQIAFFLEIKVSELGQVISKSVYKWTINKMQYIPNSGYNQSQTSR